MELSPSDKARIEAEERYRAEIRGKRNGCGCLMAALLLLLAVVLGWAVLNRYVEQQQAREELLRPLSKYGIR